jgi:hypothetical protein
VLLAASILLAASRADATTTLARGIVLEVGR